MALSEFELIERYFASSADAHGRGVALGIGDDCALLEVPAGQQLAVSIDTLVSGVHFPADAPPARIARRALAACLSDLAAMGAEPAWLTLALTLPAADPAWLEPFGKALAEGAADYGVALVGGDTTRGPLTLSLQVHGWVPRGEALRRDGGRPGDAVFVTGTLGDAMAGLDQLLHVAEPAPALVERFYRPQARIATGLALRPYASAAIDISDGLVADLGHLMDRSGCGARIDFECLPLSEALRSNYAKQQALSWAGSGGEDFELCFTVPPERLAAFEAALAEHTVPVTRIGTLESQPGLRMTGADADVASRGGYRHF
ncbi:thiamine-phosphate kinase [Motiliproteus sp. SC1-56]|uniref:thiamine-phosphate kinase n=1 Tax=Motiliproteus sp. SC1-56 TaxID=2799565 RepID=UPI001A8D458B|nr:thiamine-phosphate kinase [Motiliproteus sp. SC1-56]